MYFSFSITTPANTAESDKKKTKLKLSAGIIHQVHIANHRGNRGTLHLQIFQGGHQVYPLNSDGDFHGDGVNITFKDFFELKRGLNILTAKTWNDSTSYPHECICEFGILPRWVLLPFAIAEKVKSGIETLIGKTKEI